MATRWMLLALAVVAYCPLTARAQYRMTERSHVVHYESSPAWAEPSCCDSGDLAYVTTPAQVWTYNPCVPGYRVFDPWGNLLEPGVIACTPAYDCTDTVTETKETSTHVTGSVTPREFAQLQDKVRELELRVETLERPNN